MFTEEITGKIDVLIPYKTVLNHHGRILSEKYKI